MEIQPHRRVVCMLTVVAALGCAGLCAADPATPRSDTEALEQKRLPDQGEVGKELEAHVEATPESGKAPLQVQFDAHVEGGTPPVTLSWTFGDGTAPSSKGEPVHTYQKPGVYRATLAVKDSTGDASDHWLEIRVE